MKNLLITQKIKEGTYMCNRLIIIMLPIFIALSIPMMVVNGYGGGGSVGGQDIYGNVFKSEINSQNLVFNQSIKYKFTTPELSIYEVLVNGKNNEPDISVKVEDLINSSEYVNKSAPGVVYKNENVWIGTGRINYDTIRFRVNNSWMNSNGLDNSNYPHLLKWNGDIWLVVQTNMTNKDDTYTYFEAPRAGSTSASIFAISAQRQLTPTATVNSDPPVATNIVNTDPVTIDASVVRHNDYTKLEIGIVAIVVVLIFYMLRLKKI